MLVVYLFVCFVIVGFLSFLFLLSLFFFLYYQLYHHHLLIPTLTPFTLPPSPVPNPLLSFPTTHSTLSHPLSPPASPSLPILPRPVTRLPLPLTHSSPADQPPIPTLHSPKPLQSLTQAPSTITTETHPNTHRTTKTSSPHTASPTHPLYFPPSLLVPPYATPQISITNL
jgi:hypothetical protein